MIVLIGGEKGGTGKTTIATNLAAIRAKKDSSVLLIDADRQRSASGWGDTRDILAPTFRVRTVPKWGENLADEILNLKRAWYNIIIDAGGANNVELRAAMTVADKIYSPLQPSQLDIWTVGKIDALIATAKEYNKNLVAKILINRAPTNPQVKEVEEAKEALGTFTNLELSPCILKERVAYRKAAKMGMSVTELPELDAKAVDEIMNLYNEVFDEKQ